MAKRPSKPAPTPKAAGRPRGGWTTAKGEKFDESRFKETTEHAAQIKMDHSKRLQQDQEMEAMVLMDLDLLQGTGSSNPARLLASRGVPKDELKETISPDARNKLMGFVRLLMGSEPQFDVSGELNNPGVKATAESMEKMAAMMLRASGRQRRMPIHYEALLSAGMYGRLFMDITSTEDMLAEVSTPFRRDGDEFKPAPAVVERVRQLQMRTPYYYQVVPARFMFPEYDDLGLVANYREHIMPLGAVYDRFGPAARHLFGGRSRYQKVTYCDLRELDMRTVWFKEMAQRPLYQQDWTLPFLNVVAQITEGSFLYEKPEQQAQPFLYGLHKSHLWERQNLALTVFYTILFTIGATPKFLYHMAQEGKTLDIDWNIIGGLIKLLPNEKFESLIKQVIDPSIVQGLDLAERKGTESTIYSQALGEPLSGDAPYSMVALLNQAGRLPLIAAQRLVGWAFGDAAAISFRWLKHDAKEGRARYGSDEAALNGADVPEFFEIEADLEIDLPQDLLGSARVAQGIASGDNPLVSQRWAREKLLKVGQSEAMQKEIWNETAGNLQALEYFVEQQLRIRDKMMRLKTPVSVEMAQREEAERAAAAQGGGGKEVPPPPGNLETGPEAVPSQTPEAAPPMMPGEEGPGMMP